MLGRRLCYKVLKSFSVFMFMKKLRKSYKKKLRELLLLPRSSDFQKAPELMSIEETIKYILDNKASLCRYGDGEIGYVLSKNFQHFFQPYNPELRLKLQNIFKEPIPECLIAIPEWVKYPTDSDFGKICQVTFWPSFLKYLNINYKYGNSFCFTEKSFELGNLDLIKKLWDNRDVIVVTGKGSTFIWDERLFGNVKSVDYIYGKPVDAFSDYSLLIENVTRYSPKEDKLFLLSLGLTGTVLAYDLAKMGYQAIDMGHITNYYLTAIGEMENIEKLRQSKRFVDGQSDITKLLK